MAINPSILVHGLGCVGRREVLTQTLQKRLPMRRNFRIFQFRQLAEKLVLSRRELFGHLDIGLNVQITRRSAARIG
jgi:hypothetical protein